MGLSALCWRRRVFIESGGEEAAKFRSGATDGAGGGEGEGAIIHVSFISPHFLIVPKPRETDLPIPK